MLRLAAAALLALALACAHVPPGTAEEAGDPRPRPELVTGSNFPAPQGRSSELPPTTSNVRIYYRRDLERTGRPDTKAALQQLDPDVR